MTDRIKKRRRLSSEILATFGICFVISLALFGILLHLSVGIVQSYCFDHDIYLDEEQLYRLDSTALGGSLACAAVCFCTLFFVLFGKRLSYVRTLTDGIHALQRGELGHKVPLQGNNELTTLGEAVNYLSETELKMKEMEQTLQNEREELIRTLSHDIRTPLTSLMAYTELLQGKEELTPEEVRTYLSLVQGKTAQMKELTDILLDGGHRRLEYFDDVRLLLSQLAEEFEELLEREFTVETDLSGMSAQAGELDVRELQRILDNLISNVRKYADPAFPVTLKIETRDGGLTVRQSNRVRAYIYEEGSSPSASDPDTAVPTAPPTESFRIGISSMRRIARYYGGGVSAERRGDTFEIVITFSNI